LIAAHVVINNGDNGNGASQLQWQWGKKTGAIAMGHWGKSNRSNRRQWQWGNGAHDRSIVFLSCCNGDGDRNCNGNGAKGLGQLQLQLQWHWGTGAGATEQCCNGNGATIYRVVLLYVVLQRKTSTIVVDETVQNVWTANIPDVLRWNKTCMICSGIVFGVSELYSKVELVNAFRINSSLKWSKINSNRDSNIISECSKPTGEGSNQLSQK
jgi:hypothetical protein